MLQNEYHQYYIYIFGEVESLVICLCVAFRLVFSLSYFIEVKYKAPCGQYLTVCQPRGNLRFRQTDTKQQRRHTTRDCYVTGLLLC